jgi:SAM-dependent methyltransferase
MAARAIPGLAEAKQHTRATWAAGDFDAVAHRTLWPVGERLVERIGVRPGEDVLDVACGTGNAAIRAAAAGGRTVGVDLTPELFDAGRANARAAGVSIDWVEGDAEQLPFDDGQFDVVLSTFGVMFAPRHQVVADELVRVLRPGGRIGLCSWSADGTASKMFRLVGEYAPPPPPFAEPPLLWGEPDHVRELFRNSDVTLEFAHESVSTSPFESAEEALEFAEENFGPMIMLRGYLEPRGEWQSARERLLGLFDPAETSDYLVVIAQKDPASTGS